MKKITLLTISVPAESSDEKSERLCGVNAAKSPSYARETMRGRKITLLTITLFALGGLSNRANAQTVKDIDGNVYNTVTIGTQIWMAENLKVTKYRNGDAISNVTDNTAWYVLTTGAYCNYNNDIAKVSTYGRLYNWYAATDSRNIAPTGWHVPTDAEWGTLITYLGGNDIAGGKLKTIGNTWTSPNTGADNSSGFSGLPGGYRNDGGTFGSIGNYGYLWSFTQSSATNAYYRYLYYSSATIDRYNNYKNYGFSVRCIRDGDGGVGIKEDIDNSRFALYPNPVTNELHIETFGTHTKQKFEILNVMGQIIYSAVMEEKSVVDMRSFPGGMYLIRILSDNATATMTWFVKE